MTLRSSLPRKIVRGVQSLTVTSGVLAPEDWVICRALPAIKRLTLYWTSLKGSRNPRRHRHRVRVAALGVLRVALP